MYTGYEARLSIFCGYLDIKLIELVNYYIFGMQEESIIVIKWLLSNENGKSTHHARIGLLQEHRNLQKNSIHYPTCSRTGSGIASVICVVINPGRIALHRIPCLRERERGK